MSFTLGFTALAYPASDLSSPVSPCQCSLAFRCDHGAKQATLLLIATIPTIDAPQTFAVQYDADKLLPGAVSLTCGNDHIPQLQLDELMRVKGASSDIRTLAIHVAQPCPVWCPPSQVYTHKPGFERPFQDLVELTKATSIHIVFDYKYLQKPYHGMFKAFAKAAKSLSAFPVERLLVVRGLRKASWNIFGPVDAIGAPPVYATSRKRSREANSTSPPRSPKRLAPQSPTESHTSEKTVPLSPALAEAFERRFLKTSPALDNQTEVINDAVAKQLPKALAQVLPNIIRDMIPSLCISASTESNRSTPRASFASHASPHKQPHSSFSSNTSPRTKLPKLSPLGYAILPHLSTHLTDQFAQYQAKELAKFRKLLDELYDSAEGDRAHETALMMEDMEEHKAEVLILRDDTVDELNKQISEAFDQGRQEACDVGDELTERLQFVFDELCGTIDGLKRTTLKGLVASEVRRYQRGRRRVPVGGSKRPKHCAKRMLGKRREAESEWEDISSFDDDDVGGFVCKNAKYHI
ncbi:hypothetical protein OPT61_g3747 [Boeremia exigua]|uniref:Uncharacterized protein n=1 Tax=Boeremia exigua TaxID=749465 RepID=A0ACC2IGS8_9PLEO|nr:hypothetical protein OPT61_g3747 [Boeremia exigua]